MRRHSVPTSSFSNFFIAPLLVALLKLLPFGPVSKAFSTYFNEEFTRIFGDDYTDF
jgi:hypothetical protein